MQINDRTGYASNSSRRVIYSRSKRGIISAMLNYVTYKYVVLKDFRLGILYYVLVASIVLYTLTEIFFNKGYLHVSGPHRVGAVLLIATVCTTRNVYTCAWFVRVDIEQYARLYIPDRTRITHTHTHVHTRTHTYTHVHTYTHFHNYKRTHIHRTHLV